MSMTSNSQSVSQKSRQQGTKMRSLSTGGKQLSGTIVHRRPEGRISSLADVAKSVGADIHPEGIPLPLSRSSSPSPSCIIDLVPSQPEEHNPLSIQDHTSTPSPNRDRNKDEREAAERTSMNTPENIDEEVHRVRIEPDRTGWARIYDLVRELDKTRVVDIKEDIDTLLVFAGLFSAVVTAFIIESYKNLQQQPEDLTNQILMQLSIQISHLSVNGNFINSTIPDFTTPSFQKPRVFSIINTLWILSLLIALVTASLCILVKQWLHELLAYETHDPMERLKLRFFREAGIERWKVFAISSSLPLLLQLALLLFFVGLAFFFHQLDAIVAWFTTGTAILWLASLLFAAVAPAFSSQCPYKTPFLKGAISHLRVSLLSLSWPKKMSGWLLLKTPEDKSPRLHRWFRKLFLQLLRRSSTSRSLEEGAVSKDGSWSLPVIAYARDLLQGERLRDSILECIGDISVDDMKKTSEEIGRHVLPNLPHALAGAMSAFALEVAQDDHLRSVYFGQGAYLSSSATLYFCLTHPQSRVYTPTSLVGISSHSLPAFISLLQENPLLAALSFLVMYSIRHRSLTDHPNSFLFLFLALAESEKHSYGIGDRFLSNLLIAVRSLIHSMWDQPRDESDERLIGELVEAIRDNADGFNTVRSLDPIAFISVFVTVLCDLVPDDVLERNKDEVYEVMGELASINMEWYGSDRPTSRKECVTWAQIYLSSMGLKDQKLFPRLTTLNNSLSVT